MISVIKYLQNTGSVARFATCLFPTKCSSKTVLMTRARTKPLLFESCRPFAQNAQSIKEPKKLLADKRKLRFIAMGVAGFGAYIVALIFYEKAALEEKLKEERKAKSLTMEPLPYLEGPPPSPSIARSIRNPNDNSGVKLTLYQYQNCPFCCKVRAFLDYYGFSYDVVEVNSITRNDVKWSKYKKVPALIVEIPGAKESTYIQLKDSSVIISLLSSCLRNPKESFGTLLASYPVYKDAENFNKLQFDNKYFIMYTETEGLAKKQKFMERRLRRWVDEKFIHSIAPNVYQTPAQSLQAFQWYSEVAEWEKTFSSWERLMVVYFGAAIMWIIGKRIKSRYNISPDPRLTLYDQADLWVRELNDCDFVGGGAPNLADLGMYGALSSMEGCEAFGDMLAHTQIGGWYNRMRESVRARKGEHKLVERQVIT